MGNSFTLSALKLPHSSTALIEVEATDGFNTTNFFKVALLPHNVLQQDCGVWLALRVFDDVRPLAGRLSGAVIGLAFAKPPEQLIYTIAYTNTSPFTATNVIVEEVVSDDTTYVAAASAAGWNCEDVLPGSTCTYSVGVLPAQASGSLLFAVLVDPSLDPGVSEIYNGVTVRYNGGLAPGANSSEVLVPVQPAAAARASGDAEQASELKNQIYLPLIQNEAVTPQARSSFKKATSSRQGN